MASCNACDGTGWVADDLPVGHPHFGRLLPCPACREPELRRERARRLQDATGLTAHEREADLERIITRGRPGAQAMVLSARALLAGNVSLLTVWGPPGNGKTTLAAAIVNAAVADGRGAVYVTLAALLERLRAQYDDGGQRDLLREYQAVPVLALDEVDKPRLTDWGREQLFALLDARYRQALATVVVLNANPDDALPPWIVSRLREGDIVRNDDPDMRPAIARARKKK